MQAAMAATTPREAQPVEAVEDLGYGGAAAMITVAATPKVPLVRMFQAPHNPFDRHPQLRPPPLAGPATNGRRQRRRGRALDQEPAPDDGRVGRGRR